MNIWNSSKYALGTLAVAGLLAGCSGGSQSGLTPAAMNPAHSVGAHANKTMKPYGIPVPNPSLIGLEHGFAQMHHATKVHPNVNYSASGALLFVTDPGFGETDIYKYASGTMGPLVAQIFGMNQPQGTCTGRSKAPGTTGQSMVWITNTGTEQIYGYLRGYTSPRYVVNVYDPDPGNFPVGCSLDPKTGNLAVTNIEDTSGGPGSIAIFTPATQAVSNASPDKILYAPNMYHYYFIGYDGSGNLFVDGLDNSLTVAEYAWFQANSNSSTQLTLCGPGSSPPGCNPLNPTPPRFFPGQVQWDSETGYMSIGNQGDGATYPSNQWEFAISGGFAVQKKNTPFNIVSPPAVTPYTDVVQYWLDIRTDRLFAPDFANGVDSLYQHSNGGGCGNPCYPTVVNPGPPFSGSGAGPIGNALLRG